MYGKSEDSMYPLDYQGLALTHQKIVPGNTITSLSSYCYKYSLYRLNFDAGTADNLIQVGDWVIGADSTAAAKVVYVTVTSGTWAANTAAGYCLIDSWNGTAWTNNEKIKIAADATIADVDQAAAIVEATDAEYNLAYRLPYKGKLCQYAMIVVYANTALVDWTGGKPDQTALIGTPLAAGAGVYLTDANHLTNFRCVDYTAASASILQVKFFF